MSVHPRPHLWSLRQEVCPLPAHSRLQRRAQCPLSSNSHQEPPAPRSASFRLPTDYLSSNLLSICQAIICVRMCAKSLQSCSTLWDPMEYSLPSTSVHGILQARILEWVAVPSSRGSSQPMDGTCISYVSCTGRQILYHERHLGSPGYSLRSRNRITSFAGFKDPPVMSCHT